MLPEAREGNHQLCEELLEKNADPNLTDKKGRTPLYFVCSSGNNSLVENLISKGANVHAEGCLQAASQHGHLSICKFLVSQGVNKDSQDRNGRTPISVAAQNRQYNICDYFLQLGANINLFDNNNISPLYHLCEDGNLGMVEKFIAAGANVNADGCLQIAMDLYYNDVAQTLLKHHCDVNKVG